MKLVRRGSWSSLEGVMDRDAVYKLLDPAFSFRMEGAQFSEAFQLGRWDGRIHLVRKQNGRLVWPSGLDLEVRRKLGREVSVVDGRPSPARTFDTSWVGHPPRDYQEEAVEAVLRAEGGIVRLPIRAGKTLVAALIVHRLGVRTLFVVPSDMLLRQSAEAFREALGGARVTTIGAGEWDATGDVVVATIQTLCSRAGTRAFGVDIAQGFPLCFVDEFHHMSTDGDAWRDVALDIKARWKVGLSATININLRKRNERSDIWLRGICGPIVASRTISELIEAGYLVRPTVRWIEHGAPEDSGDGGWQSVYKRAVVDCEARNAALVREACRYAERGLGVLVDTMRVGHARALGMAVGRKLGGAAVAVLTGSSSRGERDEVLGLFRIGRIRVICGTILGEGIDLPRLDVVVNAEGSKDRTPVIQRLRNLTPDPERPGKEAVVVEMVDRHAKLLSGWVKARVKIYAGEPAFVQEFP